MMRSDCM